MIFDVYDEIPRRVYAVQWKGGNLQECNDFIHEFWDPMASAEVPWDSDSLNVYAPEGKSFGGMPRGAYIVKNSWQVGIILVDREYFETRFRKRELKRSAITTGDGR